MSVNGNNFVILDETQQPVLSELQKSEFAYFATNANFGIGCDNMLVVQNCTDSVLRKINEDRRYWTQRLESSCADYVFRMFEPNGDEALSCGNGLKCIASYLFSRYGLKQAKIATEIPFKQPRVVKIGTDSHAQTSWVNLGFPRRVPESLYLHPPSTMTDDPIDRVDGIQVTFRENDLAPYSKKRQLTLSGYLVFTGEPHLVVTETGLSIPEVSRTLFTASTSGMNEKFNADRRVSFGSTLIRLIGEIVNKTYGHVFPAGINIDFVRCLPGKPIIEFRCFERGIEKETLACGTGALASVFVMRRLDLISDRIISVWPHRCRVYQPDAEITVEEKPDGWVLSSRPTYLFSGNYYFSSTYDELGEKVRFTDKVHRPEMVDHHDPCSAPHSSRDSVRI